jgi:hypothetical protein
MLIGRGKYEEALTITFALLSRDRQVRLEPSVVSESAHVSIRHHTSAYISIRQYTPAYVSSAEPWALNWLFRLVSSQDACVCRMS